MKISKRRASRWIRIAIVIVTKAIVNREPVGHAPCVLRKNAKSALGILILPGHRLARNRVIRKTAFRIWLVIDQVNHAVVLEVWLSVGRSKEREIVAVPAFSPNADGMFSMNVSENIAPVIIVFGILGISKTDSPANSQIIDIYDRNRKQPFLRICGLQIVIAKECLVQRVGRKSMCFAPLERNHRGWA